MSKILDLNKTVAELVTEYPEVKSIMADIGFQEITSPAALEIMGKVMTIPKGCKVKGIDLGTVIHTFEENGFEVTGAGSEKSAVDSGSAAPGKDPSASGNSAPDTTEPDRVSELKSLIRRVGDGEDIASVRKDFVRQFESVSVHEIAAAEQGLIQDGMPQEEVMQLCDLHSALFHGKTEAEVWQEEEQEQAEKGFNIEPGHPVDQLRRENAALEKLADRALELLDQDGGAAETELSLILNRLKKIRILYGKKEEILMPVLYHYGITGPSEVMWGVDDEIKREVSRLASRLPEKGLEAVRDDLRAVLNRIKEMIYKEEKIFLPLCLEHFTEDEWADVYRDLPEMGPVFMDAEDLPKWERGEKILSVRAGKQLPDDLENGVLHFEAGELTVAQLKAILDLLPVDLTFIDENHINRYYKNTDRIFSRPLSSLNRPVFDCHPARIRPMIETLLSEFKAGTKDSMERWIPNPERPVRIVYAAVRDKDGKYLGTLEMVQEFSGIMEKLKNIKS